MIETILEYLDYWPAVLGLLAFVAYVFADLGHEWNVIRRRKREIEEMDDR